MSNKINIVNSDSSIAYFCNKVKLYLCYNWVGRVGHEPCLESSRRQDYTGCQNYDPKKVQLRF